MQPLNASRCFFFLVMLAVTVARSTTACAADPPGYPENIQAYDPREVAMLPSYCKYTQIFETHVPGGQNKAQQERLKALMGNTFYALHHYCWGLMNTNRGVLLARTAQYRQLYLRASISEFDYVIQRAPRDFVLLPEILTRKGENLIRLGQGSFAVPELRRAIELKPDYWPPYAALSDYYKSAGQADQAREILEKGLAVMPGEKALKARLSATVVSKHTPPKRSD